MGIYPATRYNFKLLFHDYWLGDGFAVGPHLAFLAPLTVLDIPVAIVTDTIFITYDLNDLDEFEKIKIYKKKELSLVIDFVKNNNEVIKAVKGIRNVYPYSISRHANEVLPFKYIMSVSSLDKENNFGTIFVAVNVSRKDSTAKFTLACFWPSSGNNGPLKTECE
ncbi:MAG: YceK/YidQ family lipoprotein [Smithella sp.]